MRYDTFIAIALLTGGAPTAHAFSIAHLFSPLTEATIELDDLMATLAEVDPELALSVVDFALTPANAAGGIGRQQEVADVLEGLNSSLAGFRSESLIDRVTTLHRPRAGGSKRQHTGQQRDDSSRSAESSLEIIEMMKRAKAAKKPSK